MRRLATLPLLVLLLACTSADTANEQGKLAFARHEYAVATQHFAVAVKAAPDVPRYRYNLALALAKRGSFDSALLETREVLRLDPGNAKASKLLTEISRALEARRADAIALTIEH